MGEAKQRIPTSRELADKINELIEHNIIMFSLSETAVSRGSNPSVLYEQREGIIRDLAALYDLLKA